MKLIESLKRFPDEASCEEYLGNHLEKLVLFVSTVAVINRSGINIVDVEFVRSAVTKFCIFVLRIESDLIQYKK